MKKPTPAQLAARARFAEMARSGAFKRKAKRKANPQPVKMKIRGSETPDNPEGIVVTEAGALRWAKQNMPKDLKRAGFVPSVVAGARGWSINYGAAVPGHSSYARNPRKKTVSQKISQLVREGYPQKQAVAVALSEQRAGKVKATPRKRNPAPKFSVGDPVKFAPAVVKRVGGDARTKNMRGVIIEIMSGGKTALVDTRGTFVSEEGNSVRGIPTANLVLDLKSNPATGRKGSGTKLNPVVYRDRAKELRSDSKVAYAVHMPDRPSYHAIAYFSKKADAMEVAQETSDRIGKPLAVSRVQIYFGQE